MDSLESISPNISYKAVVNNKAIVGEEGNPNKAEFFYSNNPTKGNTYDNLDKKPDKGNGITSKEDSKIVYTYQIAFRKVDSVSKTPLIGAIFGVYDTSNKLIDIVTTNKNGYAISTQVSSGKYKIKELKAPKGYSLNTETYEITANWVTATVKTSANSKSTTYTSDKNKATDNSEQVGWLKNGIFYSIDSRPTGNDVKEAYIESTKALTDGTTFSKSNEGSGTVLLETDIPNTKLGELPSTGSIGTYLFKAIGSAAMIGAIGIYIVKRRKA